MFNVRRILLIGVVLSLVFTVSFSSLAIAAEPVSKQEVSSSEKVDIGVSKCYHWYHQIISEKPLYLNDGETDTWYDTVKGKVVIKWNNLIPIYNSLNAELQANNKVKYEFTLVSCESYSSDFIKGTFDIKKNGVLVASNIKGQLYGLNLSEGEYFKFYSDDMKWHFSAYITDRIDGSIGICK
ncbi:hypothetical protein EHE19_002300 [Ruminiclostridium herbifermentans]|uniref:Uncharacterized protein n=1 Tax=Ruminiclostridium herbifermentans TaxID=2488810 RepID=A0A4U7JJB5_9FIRM|nr:hypothetical protein [Ruminiclostridium herbifermentans]QNU67391.1 hypothetical protein EHE19_002300 [Ruminiclostridium herbifermentans]